MTTDQAIATLGAYADAFGEEHAEALLAPNYVGIPEFLDALAAAVSAGVPMTIDEAASRFGSPAREFVV